MGERIVLGLGNNIDYEIAWDSRVFEQLIGEYDITAAELCTNKSIATTRDLVISILGFLASETGGERFVASPQIIEDFAKRFQYKITLGGTSVRAAIAMRKLGYTSALHLVTMNDHVRHLIPQDSPWVCSNDRENIYPHLIVQYYQGIRVQAGNIHIHTNHSNRMIYVNDDDNLVMELSPELVSLAAEAHVLLISGFNAMHSSDLLAKRLEQLLDMLSSLPSKPLIFYEDACFHEPALSAQVHHALSAVINIYSLNENELQEYVGRKIALLDAGDVYAALKTLAQMIPVPVFVIHTQYWALAFGSNAARYAKALKGGVTMATTRFRCGDEFSPSDYLETEGLPAHAEGAAFAAMLNHLAGTTVCCIPVAQVKQTDATTIGLGDAFVGGFLPALVM